MGTYTTDPLNRVKLLQNVGVVGGGAGVEVIRTGMPVWIDQSSFRNVTHGLVVQLGNATTVTHSTFSYCQVCYASNCCSVREDHLLLE